jgi:hypothetical protein
MHVREAVWWPAMPTKDVRARGRTQRMKIRNETRSGVPTGPTSSGDVPRACWIPGVVGGNTPAGAGKTERVARRQRRQWEHPARAGMTRSEISSRSSSASAVVASIAADDRGPRLGACSRTERGPAFHDDARESAARHGLDGQARHEGQRALQGARGLPADPLPATSRQTAKLGRMARGCSPESKGTEATHRR